MKKKSSSKVRKSAARKTSAVPTKVLTIGIRGSALTPDALKLIHDEVFAAHLYKRKLIDLNNTRKSRYRRIRRLLSPRLAEMEAQYDALGERLYELRKGLKKKSERKTSPEQIERIESIDALKLEKFAMGLAIGAERKLVDETHDWKSLEAQWKDMKERRLLEAARARGKKKLGPNDKARERVVRELYEEFLRSDRPREWLVKLRADRAFHRSSLRARYLASNAPPPGIAKLSPGTYLAVEAAITQALRDSFGPLQKRRFDRTGRIGTQLTQDKGLKTADVLSGRSEWLKIEILESQRLRRVKSDTFHPSHSRKVDLHAEERRLRAEKFAREPHLRPYRKAVRLHLKLSGRRKDSVYLDMQGILHQALPDDGVIKWAYLNVDRHGYDFTYELQLTVESKSFAPKRRRPGTGRKLSINLGWRVIKGSRLRTATTFDGVHYDFIYLDRPIPPTQNRSKTMLGTHRCNEVLLTFTDNHFNKAIKVAREWMTQLSPEEKERLTPIAVEALPRHQRSEKLTLGNITATMSKWRDHGRLLRLVSVLRQRAGFLDVSTLDALWSKWRDARLAAKADLFVDEFAELQPWLASQGITSLSESVAFYLEIWRRKEIHLTTGARRAEAKLKRNITDRYRKIAYRLGLEYDEIAIEKWDKAETAKAPKYEDDWRCPQEEKAAAIRQFVGISKLVNALKNQLRDDLHEVPAMDITTEHYGCGGSARAQINPDKPGLSPTPMLQCDKCHRDYDQDVNAAKHLWQRAFGERSAEPVLAGTARKRKPRENRVHQDTAGE